MASHRSETVLPYMAEQLFDLAADVERYPEFLPGWFAARVRKRDGDGYETDQVVGFGIFRQRFASKTVLRRPNRIDVTSTEWPFRRFHLTWHFEPLPQGGCRVVLTTAMEFRSRLAAQVFGLAIARLAENIIAAFERRAHRLYGRRSDQEDTPGTPRSSI